MAKAEDILVEVKGVSKKFSRNLKRSLWYGLKDMTSSVLGIENNGSHLRKDEFWAVKDINFTLRRGECLGLIGRNGAGKSTLLKMLNGLIRPDEGSIAMRGKIGALIELGAGFNPLLTGRENIFVNGQLLGFSKKEIEKKFDAIIDFAEIGEFIDSPIQNYSSGMKVRLGFAIASQMEPDVLLIDEVLAVGDMGFVLKCFNTIDTLMEKTAVVFVAHNMPMISRVCTNVMLLEKGKSLFQGNDVSKGIDMYYKEFSNSKKGDLVFNRNDDAELIDVHVERSYSTHDVFDSITTVNRFGDLKINIKFKIKSKFSNPAITLVVFDKEQRGVGVCQNENGIPEKNIFKSEDGFDFYKVQLIIPRITLSKGVYSISFLLAEKLYYKPVIRLNSVCEFQVYSKLNVWHPVEFEGQWK